MASLKSATVDIPNDKKSKSVKSRLTKTKRLEKELQAEQEKVKDYLNRLMYLQADFDNYRKRTEKQMQEIIQYSSERLIVNFLSIVDEMEMAIKAGKETESKEPLLKGIEIVLKKMYTTLEREGVTKIEAVGKPFNPKMHEVATKVPSTTDEEGIILEEVRKGFMLRDKVIRPSIVNIGIGDSS